MSNSMTILIAKSPNSLLMVLTPRFTVCTICQVETTAGHCEEDSDIFVSANSGRRGAQ